MTDTPPVILIAHRGASHDAPENTLAAIQLGWQQADAVEIDVQITFDRVPVVIHDANTRRTCKVNRIVRTQSHEELQRLDAGRWKHLRWRGQSIPTLREVLKDRPKGKRIFIEIKPAEGFPEVWKLLHSHCSTDPEHIIFLSEHIPTLTVMREQFPVHPILWIPPISRKSAKPKPDHIWQSWIHSARQSRFHGIAVDHRHHITRESIRIAHDAGLSVFVWTVNETAAARRLVAAGVDGVITNRPAWIRKHLKPLSRLVRK